MSGKKIEFHKRVFKLNIYSPDFNLQSHEHFLKQISVMVTKFIP